MKTFDLLIIFNKRLLYLILLSLIHAGKRQIICKEYYRTKLVPSFLMFLPFETSEHETAVAISFQGMRQRFEFVNFKEHKFFFFLKITALAKRVVKDSLSCAFSCLDNLACFSFKVARFPDKAGKCTCEILSSDKYNNSENFLPSQDSPSLQHCVKKFIFELCFKI